MSRKRFYADPATSTKRLIDRLDRQLNHETKIMAYRTARTVKDTPGELRDRLEQAGWYKTPTKKKVWYNWKRTLKAKT